MSDAPTQNAQNAAEKRAERARSVAVKQTRRSLLLETRLWLLALFCGILVGLAMAALRFAIVGIELVAFGVDDERLATAAGTLAPWRAVIVPVLGGVVVSALLYLGIKFGLSDKVRVGGIRDVIYARQHMLDRRGRTKPLKDMHLSLKDGLFTGLIAMTALGTGASAGREGPAVHMGASLSGFLAYRFDFTTAQIRALLGCGAAAAVASSFNAPLAGLLFAHEVILHRYRISDIGPIAVASVAGALVTRLTFGDDSVFVAPNITETPIHFFVATPILGLVAAAMSILIIRTWIVAPGLGNQFAAQMRIPVWALPPIAGLVIGLFALAFPQVLGVGYEPTAAAIAGGYGAAFMLILAAAKIAATAICIGARFGGGVFSASIFVGAMMGGFFGAVAGMLTGDIENTKVFFTVVGMGAVSGAVLGAPISTTLIVFELTRSYETAAAVLVAVSLATVIVQAREGGGIFDLQLKAERRR